jgi:hypothetical protein
LRDRQRKPSIGTLQPGSHSGNGFPDSRPVLSRSPVPAADPACIPAFFRDILPRKTGGDMRLMLEALRNEKKRLEAGLSSAVSHDAERENKEKLETVNSDIQRLEQIIDRPTLQTSSELFFIDDIRLRINRIREAT